MSKLRLYKGQSKKLSSHSRQDGQLLFTVDTKKLYIDSNTTTEGGEQVDRICINPNSDWNAQEGTNEYIANKPNYISGVFLSGDTLVVETADGIQKGTTVVEVDEYSGTNGDFILMGNFCHYIIKEELLVESMTSLQSIELDTFPSGITPKYTINHPVLTDSAQLSDSIIIVFDKTSNKILLKNRSSDILTNITLIPSTYDFVISGYSRVTNSILQLENNS